MTTTRAVPLGVAAVTVSGLAAAAGVAIPAWLPYVVTPAVLAMVVRVVVKARKPLPAPGWVDDPTAADPAPLALTAGPRALPSGDRWQFRDAVPGQPVVITSLDRAVNR